MRLIDPMRNKRRRPPSVPNETEFASPQAAIEAFVAEGWHDDVYRRLAARYQRSRGSAAVEDAVEHALEKAVEGLRTRNGRQVYSFILTAAERRLLDGARRQRRAEAHGWLESVEGGVSATSAPGTETSIETAWADRDARAIAHEACAVLIDKIAHPAKLTLPPRTLEVLRLFHLDGLTKREIRARTGLTEKQLRTSLSTGNAVLHDQFVAIEAELSRGCRSSRPAVLRMAFDLASRREAARARVHLQHCLACARLVPRAQAFRRNAAAFVPLPAVGLPRAGGGAWGRMVDSLRVVTEGALSKASTCFVIAGLAASGVVIATGEGGPDAPSANPGASRAVRTDSHRQRAVTPKQAPSRAPTTRPSRPPRTRRKATHSSSRSTLPTAPRAVPAPPAERPRRLTTSAPQGPAPTGVPSQPAPTLAGPETEFPSF